MKIRCDSCNIYGIKLEEIVSTIHHFVVYHDKKISTGIITLPGTKCWRCVAYGDNVWYSGNAHKVYPSRRHGEDWIDTSQTINIPTTRKYDNFG